MKIVLMGVAGCGKSSVGAALSARIGVPYRDGDDLHPAENIRKMSQGQALTDVDRAPWLDLVGQALAAGPMIIGCSALKRIYRERIADQSDGAIIFVHLAGARPVIEARMRARTGHFMPPALLDSQFATLEPPAPDECAIMVNIDQPLKAVVNEIVAGLETR